MIIRYKKLISYFLISGCEIMINITGEVIRKLPNEKSVAKFTRCNIN